MDGITDARLWLDFAQWIVTLALGVYVWMQQRHTATRGHIESVRESHEQQLNAHGDRLTRVESRLDNVPTHDDLSQLHTRISQVKDKVYEMAADMAGTRADVVGLKRSMEILIQHQIRVQSGEHRE